MMGKTRTMCKFLSDCMCYTGFFLEGVSGNHSQLCYGPHDTQAPLMDHSVCKNLDDQMFRRIPTLVDEDSGCVPAAAQLIRHKHIPLPLCE